MKSLKLKSHKEEKIMLSLQVPEKRQVHAPSFDEFIELYIRSKEEKITPQSLYAYRNNIRGFVEWWQGNADDYGEILSEDLFRDFFHWYRTEFVSVKSGVGASQYMVREAGIILRRVLRYAHEIGAIPENVTRMVDLAEHQAKTPYFPTLDDILAIFAQPDDHLRIRDTALMAVMCSTGCRRQEAALVKIDNIHYFDTNWSDLNADNDHSGYIYFDFTKRKSRYRLTSRVSVFDSIGGLLIKLWVGWAGVTGKKKDEKLFNINTENIYHRVVKHATAAGVPDVHPHSFRHAFNDTWLRHNAQFGEDADIARRLQLGHTFDRSDANTYHYVDWRFNPKQPERHIDRIRPYHTSPLKLLNEAGRWNWSKYPVYRAEIVDNKTVYRTGLS